MRSLPLGRLDRRERFERASRFPDALKFGCPTAIVFGSVAHGDDAAESGTDLPIIRHQLPRDSRQRRAWNDPFVAIVEREGVALR